MDRVKINISSFKYPRIDMEGFSFTPEEEASIEKSLDNLESISFEKSDAIFSISKENNMFSGNLKVASFALYVYAKSSTSIGLFYKLLGMMETKLSERDR